MDVGIKIRATVPDHKDVVIKINRFQRRRKNHAAPGAAYTFLRRCRQLDGLKLLATSCLILVLFVHPSTGRTEDKYMTVSGTFDVKSRPVPSSGFETGAGISRIEIDKTWSGPLSGQSKCEMLSSFTESTGAMAYVAMERFEGTLEGRTGSFYFGHTATMQKGDPASGVMHVSVVKNSGTGQLRGLTGELSIEIKEGKHFYKFNFTLPNE